MNVRQYLASIGRKGGKATGANKRRGDSAYYKRISQKAAKARKAKAQNDQAHLPVPAGTVERNQNDQ